MLSSPTQQVRIVINLELYIWQEFAALQSCTNMCYNTYMVTLLSVVNQYFLSGTK